MTTTLSVYVPGVDAMAVLVGIRPYTAVLTAEPVPVRDTPPEPPTAVVPPVAFQIVECPESL